MEGFLVGEETQGFPRLLTNSGCNLEFIINLAVNLYKVFFFTFNQVAFFLTNPFYAILCKERRPSQAEYP